MATVIINDTTPRVKYTANGSTTRFDFDFVCFQTADLVVYVGDTVAETGFTITHDPTTLKGYVTFDTAPAAGTGITLVRKMAYDQKVDFTQVALLKRDPLHNEFSRVFAMIQQINEAIGRSVTVDVYSDATPAELTGMIEDLWAIKDDMTTDAANIAAITTTAGSIANVNTTAANISDVNTVAGIAADVSAVAAIDDDVSDVADDLTNIDAVAGDLTNINAVSGDLTNIDAVSAALTNVGTVAGSIANVNAVSADLTNIDTAATNISDIDTAATNISDINTAATNISAIIDAPNQAANAAASATLAQEWASKMDGQVASTDYSSKYYAGQSSTYATNSASSATLASEWATKTDTTVDGNDYSAKYWALQANAERRIGQIVPSTIPLSDAGLHLADGALISGSGSYAGFVTYMAGLVSTYPDLFETEANWQQAVSDYGVCGKFVYDSVNNTIRLPKIEGFIEGTLDPTKLGDLIQAGLPNIAGQSSLLSSSNGYGATGPFGFTSSGTGQIMANVNNFNGYITFDASRSSSIYGNSTTVQPQSIKVLYYIVVANSTKTQIQVDIDQIVTDLNGKADRDLSNLSNGLANTICTTPATTTSTATSSRPAVVVENYKNGLFWYRVWSDGWIEQGGYAVGTPNFTINFLKPYRDTNYTITTTTRTGSSDYTVRTMEPILQQVSATSCSLQSCPSYNGTQFYWNACGY